MTTPTPQDYERAPEIAESLVSLSFAELAQRIADALASERERSWNAAIESAALIAEPNPHIEEERECKDVANAIRALAHPAPATEE